MIEDLWIEFYGKDLVVKVDQHWFETEKMVFFLIPVQLNMERLPPNLR